jgi:hypothetical protein
VRSLRAVLVMLAVVVVLGAVLYVTTRPRAAPPPVVTRPYVWLVDMLELARMSISLPPRGLSETWVKHTDQYWYFDKPQGQKVNMKRWGGGIPLILSGPASNRRIVAGATDEQLSLYGLANPRMRIALTLKAGQTINILVGDATPDQQAYYIKLADSGEVFTVDATWYAVLERLVLDPPYPVPGED